MLGREAGEMFDRGGVGGNDGIDLGQMRMARKQFGAKLLHSVEGQRLAENLG